MNKESMPQFVQDTLAAFQDPMWQAILGATILIFVLAGSRLFAKAGYHPLVGLLLFVPVVNVAVFLFLAFSRWPIERELRALRGVQGTARKVDQDRLRRAA
jgi:hypothetical protein